MRSKTPLRLYKQTAFRKPDAAKNENMSVGLKVFVFLYTRVNKDTRADAAR